MGLLSVGEYLSLWKGRGSVCPKVERFPGDRLEPAFALREIARPAPIIQEYPDEERIVYEGDPGATALTTLPLAYNHLTINDFDCFASDQTMALWAKDPVLIFLGVIPNIQRCFFYDPGNVARGNQVRDFGSDFQVELFLTCASLIFKNFS